MTSFKKNTLFLALAILPFFSLAQNFKIEGKAEGFTDGEWLYLDAGNLKDSCEIKNGKFKFSGSFNDPVFRVIIRTKNMLENFASFWLEAKPMTLSLRKGEFRKAIMKGSKIQEESQELSKTLAPIEQKLEGLEKEYEAASDKEAKKKEIYDIVMKLQAQENEVNVNFVKQHPNSYLAGEMLRGYGPEWGKDKTRELYVGMGDNIKQSYYGQEIRRFLAAKQFKAGDRYVDFEQQNTKGELIKLSTIKGKYILLDFWGSWCGGCREEHPNLIKTYLAFKDKGFNILGVSADVNKKHWTNAIKQDGLLWENVSDLKGDRNEAALTYGVHSYPTNFLIDDKGIIIAKNLKGEELKKKLEELLP